MDQKSLIRFLTVIEHGSLSEAARVLGITQQGVSSTIARLEAELGVKLFDRSPGGVTRLTPFGKVFVNHAKAHLAGINRAIAELHAMRDAASGTVTIGVGETFSGELIATAVAAVHGARPGIHIHLIEGHSEALIQRLLVGELDFVVSGTVDYTIPEPLIHEPLYISTDVVVVRRGHPLAERRDLRLQDLVRFTWLMPLSRRDEHETVADAFLEAGMPPPKDVIWTDAVMVGLNMMLSNDYLMMSSPAVSSLRGEAGGSRIVALDLPAPRLQRKAGVTYHGDIPLSPAANLLLRAVRDAARQVALSDREACSNGARNSCETT